MEFYWPNMKGKSYTSIVKHMRNSKKIIKYIQVHAYYFSERKYRCEGGKEEQKEKMCQCECFSVSLCMCESVCLYLCMLLPAVMC